MVGSPPTLRSRRTHILLNLALFETVPGPARPRKAGASGLEQAPSAHRPATSSIRPYPLLLTPRPSCTYTAPAVSFWGRRLTLALDGTAEHHGEGGGIVLLLAAQGDGWQLLPARHPVNGRDGYAEQFGDLGFVQQPRLGFQGRNQVEYVRFPAPPGLARAGTSVPPFPSTLRMAQWTAFELFDRQ